MQIKKGAWGLWYSEFGLHHLGSPPTFFIPRWTTHSTLSVCRPTLSTTLALDMHIICGGPEETVCEILSITICEHRRLSWSNVRNEKYWRCVSRERWGFGIFADSVPMYVAPPYTVGRIQRTGLYLVNGPVSLAYVVKEHSICSVWGASAAWGSFH